MARKTCGADLPDPLGTLQGEGEKMRHVRLMGVQDVKRKAFKDLVRAAVQLNQEKGDPTKG